MLLKLRWDWWEKLIYWLLIFISLCINSITEPTSIVFRILNKQLTFAVGFLYTVVIFFLNTHDAEGYRLQLKLFKKNVTNFGNSVSNAHYHLSFISQSWRVFVNRCIVSCACVCVAEGLWLTRSCRSTAFGKARAWESMSRGWVLLCQWRKQANGVERSSLVTQQKSVSSRVQSNLCTNQNNYTLISFSKLFLMVN